MTSAPRSGLVAVLFTDLVGSTELMSKLGERAFDELRRQHFAALSKAVAAHGGEEVKNTGDGILAVFPSAAEAVEGAVAMQQATARQAKTGPLAIRVGVAVGDATLEDGDVFGAPVVEAARLVGAAQAGQILATAVVRTLAGRAEVGFEDIGQLDLKGLPEPVAACQVAWEPLVVSSVPMPALLSRTGRIFVGRDHSLAGLDQLWKETVAGERRVALVAGEPGIGKTRLASALARSCHEEGGMVLAGRCDEDLGVPYQPFVEALRHYTSHAPEPRLGRHGGELARLVPELPETIPGLSPPLRSDPETERYRLFDAVASWIAEVSQETPLLVVLDDLQWAAKPTVLLLRHVLRSMEAMRLLLVGTYRDTDIGRQHPLCDLLADLRKEPGVERVALSGLDVTGVTAYLTQAAGHELDQAGEELARVIWRETEGMPFFVTEVVRHLTESGALERRDDRWVVAMSIDDLGIPEGVRDVVGRRLSRLSDEVNQVLACASVAGLEFEPAVVQTAGNFKADTVFSALEQAGAARLLAEVPGPVPRNRFAHALVRAKLYDELSAARRVALHHKVAEAIEGLHAENLDDHLPGLAHHWAQAAPPPAAVDRAVEYARRAGNRASDQLAHDEAAAYYARALELLDTRGHRGEHGRLELLIALGEAQRRAGDPDHRGTLLRAADLAQRLGEISSLVRSALANSRGHLFTAWNVVDVEKVAALEAALASVGPADSPERARLLATLALELVFDAEAAERRVTMSDEALAMARRLQDPATVVPVLVARYASTMPNPVAERLSNSAELLDAAQAVGDPLRLGQAWGMRFRALFESGDVDDADRCLARAATLVEDVGQPLLRWMLTYLRVARAIVGSRFDEAEHLAVAARGIGVAMGQEGVAVTAAQLFLIRFAQGALDDEAQALLAGVTEHRLPLFEVWQVLLYCELGREAAARARLTELRPGKLPRDLFWLTGMCSWATVAATLGEVALAEDLHDALLPYADHALTIAVLPMPAVVYHLGLLSATLGGMDEAEEHFRTAVRVHERLKAPAWLAQTRLEWGRMLLTRAAPGDVERASELLGQALGTARELGLANVERRAVELLR